MKAAKHPRARSRATERHNKKQPVPNLTAERLQASAALLPARYHVPAVGFEPTRSCLQWPPNQSRNQEACLVDAENAEHTRHRQLATRCRVARRRAYWRRSARTRTHKALNTSIVQRTNATDNNQAPGVVRRPYMQQAPHARKPGQARRHPHPSCPGAQHLGTRRWLRIADSSEGALQSRTVPSVDVQSAPVSFAAAGAATLRSQSAKCARITKESLCKTRCQTTTRRMRDTLRTSRQQRKPTEFR